jgi:hypothetical protein
MPGWDEYAWESGGGRRVAAPIALCAPYSALEAEFAGGILIYFWPSR